ncbi:MAG: hypothetical protein FWD57_14075 [Polyangiaceae bacterium]|nr:hypothetical protein [Polyangiaceae bacterium]
METETTQQMKDSTKSRNGFFRISHRYLPVLLCITALTSITTPTRNAIAEEPNTAAIGASNNASDTATARDLFRDGVRYAEEGNWKAALDAYERSFALRPSNLTIYSIAVVQEHGGLLVEAMENLRAFLRSDHDKTTSRYIPAAEELLSSVEGRVGRIKVVVPENVPEAQVWIDNQLVPQAAVGVYRSTNPGEHKVELRVPQHSPRVEMVPLRPGESLEVILRLGDPIATPTLAPVLQPNTDALAAYEARDMRAKALIIGGVSVIAVGFCSGIYGFTAARASETSDGPRADTARTMALVGDVSMGVGVLFTAIGAYLLLDNPKPVNTYGLQVSPWVSQSAGGVSARTKF